MQFLHIQGSKGRGQEGLVELQAGQCACSVEQENGSCKGEQSEIRLIYQMPSSTYSVSFQLQTYIYFLYDIFPRMIRTTSNSACLTLWLTFPQISLLQNPSPKDTVAHTRKLGVISAWPDGPVRCLSLSTCSLISHHALSHPLHSSYADFLFNFSNTCSFLSGRFYKPVLSS